MAKGYTKIENNLFDFLFCNNLTASELKVLLFLIRYTKGFNRQTTRAAYSFIAKGTGYSSETCRKAIKALCDKGLIDIEYSAIGSKAQVVKVLYKNCTTSYTSTVPPLIQAELDDKVQAQYHQDIKEYITNKDIKEKKEKSLFPTTHINNMTPDEAREWREILSEDDWVLFMKGKVWDDL